MIKQIGRLSLLAIFISAAVGQTKQAPPLAPPDPRYKADLLLVVAHPDDDTLIAGYLAKLELDEHKRVAVVYCTSGGGGGNVLGYEAGAALGQMRVIEARRALESIGIDNVWFLGARDTPSQNVLWSLDAWGHGRMLEDLVRLVRLTRPEVIVTWLPEYVVGENHGDHQAAGVLATEAFDAAGDPLRFPEQVSPPRDREGMANLAEGLQPWQPKKLYYQTDAFEYLNPYWHDMSGKSPYRKSMLDGTGPVYQMNGTSSSRHESYAKLFASEQAHYGTQGGKIGADALTKNDLRPFEYPVYLIFGKSVVGGSVTGDVFENVSKKPAEFVRAPGFEPPAPNRLELQLGGSWDFYRRFWKAHAIEDVAKLIPVPEVAVDFGHALHIPLLIANQSPDAELVRVSAELPAGWTNKMIYSVYPAGVNQTYPIEAELVAPDKGKLGWQQIVFKAQAGGRDLDEVTLRVYVGKTGGLPQ